MERGNLLQLARRSWLIILAGALIGGVAAHVMASRMSPTYEATVSLLTGPINTDSNTQQAAGSIARTYADLATSTPILEQTLKKAHASTPILTFRDNVSGTSNDVTRIVSISVKAESSALAARLANTLAAQLMALGNKTAAGGSSVDTFMNDPSVTALPAATQAGLHALASRIFGETSAGHLAVVDPATPPPTPVAPRVTLITIMGIIGGLSIGALLVFLRASTTTKIDDEEELAEAKSVRILGSVSGSRRGGAGLVVGGDSPSNDADAYRVLAAKVGFAENGKPIRSLLVVDGGDGESSGVTAANLAAALAEMDANVTLVDADTITGEATKVLDLEGQRGYSNLLEETNGRIGRDDVAEFAVRHLDALAVVPLGSGNGRQVLEIDRARRLLDALQETADMVVVSGPSADRSSSALIWARAADATLVVAERRKTKRGTFERTLQSLSLADANVIGTVFRT